MRVEEVIYWSRHDGFVHMDEVFSYRVFFFFRDEN